MGCRIKENPEKLFDWFFEVTIPQSSEDDPAIVRQFPEEFNDQDSIQRFPKFCFPFDMDRVKESTVVQNFTFVLTDLEGNQRFGFCRLSVGYKTCICILSYLPWFEVFYKLLNNIADHLAKDQASDLGELLTSLYSHPVPQLHSAVSLEFKDQKFQKLSITTATSLRRRNRDQSKDPRPGTESLSYFIAPDIEGLPTIPESRNLTEFVLAVDVNNMLQLYASMLHERRILITSSKLSTLTACVHASTTMLYPMYWQNIYIPILPPHLLDYCCAPMPYLIGVHSSLMERVRDRALEDVVILNVDSNTLESPFQDLESLPADVVSLLKLRLKKQSAVTGDGLARAFLKAQALLFGSYRDALTCTPGDPITFSEESFMNHKSNTMKQFLQNAVHLQLFKEFIDGRLLKLNSGAGFSDVFEQEIDSCGLGSDPLKSYQLWVENLKKGGGALIHTVKNKANPAVKNMYKYAKGQAKMGLKEMRSRLRQKEGTRDRLLQRGGSLRNDTSTIISEPRSAHEHLQSRLPITQHFGQSRPRRPSPKNSVDEENLSLDSESNVSALTESETGPVEAGDLQEMEDHFLDTGEIDLLGEIFETLSTRASHERGVLYGTQSLDFFSFEDYSFSKKMKSLNPPSAENLSYDRRRCSDPFGSDRWYMEEERSLDFNIPSSEEVSISEDPEVQEEEGTFQESLGTIPADNPSESMLHSQNGGAICDCDLKVKEKNLQIEVSMKLQGLSSETEYQTVQPSIQDTKTQKNAGAHEVKNQTERGVLQSVLQSGETDQKISVDIVMASDQSGSQENITSAPSSPKKGQITSNRPNIQLPPVEMEVRPTESDLPCVISTVALFQGSARQKAYTWSGDRVSSAVGTRRLKNRLGAGAESPEDTGKEEFGSKTVTIYTRHRNAAEPPSWKPPSSNAGLSKVSELKKRFEA